MKKITEFLARRPRLTQAASLAALGLIGVVALGASTSLRHLNTSYSMHQFLPADHPLYRNEREAEQAFSLTEEQPMMITLALKPEARGTWLEPGRMKLVRAFDHAVAATDGIRHVTSVASVEGAASSGQGIQIGQLLSLLPSSRWKNRVLHDPLLAPNLISADGRSVALIADINFLSEQQVSSITHQVRDVLPAQFPELATQAQLDVSGVVPIQSDMAALVGRELKRFLVLAFFICALTLFAYFRSASSVAVCLALAGLSNIGALSAVALSGTSFSVLSTSLPVLASITALAIGSHTLLSLASRVRNSGPLPIGSKIRVVLDTMRQLFQPNLMMALTTATGFATLGWSKAPLIREFAWSVSGGILVSWLFVTLALVPLMILVPLPKARDWTASRARWALWAISRRKLILPAVLAVVVVLLVRGMPLNWSVRLFDDLPKIGGIRSSTELIDRKLGGMIPLRVMIRAGNGAGADAWNDPARVRKLDQLLDAWRQLPEVGSAVGLPDFIRSGQVAGKLNDRRAIAETVFLYSMAEANPLAHFLTADGESTMLMLRLRDVPADQMRRVVSRIEGDTRAAFPDTAVAAAGGAPGGAQYEVKLSGMATMVHELNAELSSELLFGLWESLLWITLLIVIVFRSLRWALVAAIPNLLAPLALLAAMSLLRTPIKPAVAVIFSIALGVAYNNTVYLLGRLKLLANTSRLKLGYEEHVGKAWYQEGNPCLFSSLALLGGFAVFLSSYFDINRTFGAYMLWSIAVGLFADLIFLPVLLKTWPRLLLGHRS